MLLADNHIWAAGGIAEAVAAARRVAGFSTKIEVEASNLEDATVAAGAGADIVMLDNYKPEALIADARILKERFPKVLVEASGVSAAAEAFLAGKGGMDGWKWTRVKLTR